MSVSVVMLRLCCVTSKKSYTLTTVYPRIIKNKLDTIHFLSALWGAVSVSTEVLAVANVIRWGEFHQVFNGCSQGQHSHV